jgi:hypothetical protein
LGRPDIGLVACSRRKADRSLPARELYVSPLFRAAFGYAERRYGPERWFILSARHGLGGVAAGVGVGAILHDALLLGGLVITATGLVIYVLHLGVKTLIRETGATPSISTSSSGRARPVTATNVLARGTGVVPPAASGSEHPT